MASNGFSRVIYSHIAEFGNYGVATRPVKSIHSIIGKLIIQ
ncbi:MAG: hypothetical protein ACJA04_000484 [Cellvibrionaceae bacterium]|jgi:hypothetical protein